MTPRIIAPSILAADFSRLGDEVRDVVAGGADWIHVDVMDGHFVPNITIGPLVIQALRPVTRLPLDIHLMVQHPEPWLPTFREAGADLITIHAEAGVHLHRCVQRIHELGGKAGVALNPHTSESALDYVLPELDLVLVMAVNPGFGGQQLIEGVFPKVERLRQRIDHEGLGTLVHVDGGVKPDNAWRFWAAGAHAVVSGTGVFGVADRAAAIRGIRESSRP